MKKNDGSIWGRCPACECISRHIRLRLIAFPRSESKLSSHVQITICSRKFNKAGENRASYTDTRLTKITNEKKCTYVAIVGRCEMAADAASSSTTAGLRRVYKIIARQ